MFDDFWAVDNPTSMSKASELINLVSNNEYGPNMPGISNECISGVKGQPFVSKLILINANMTPETVAKNETKSREAFLERIHYYFHVRVRDDWLMDNGRLDKARLHRCPTRHLSPHLEYHLLDSYTNNPRSTRPWTYREVIMELGNAIVDNENAYRDLRDDLHKGFEDLALPMEVFRNLHMLKRSSKPVSLRPMKPTKLELIQKDIASGPGTKEASSQPPLAPPVSYAAATFSSSGSTISDEEHEPEVKSKKKRRSLTECPSCRSRMSRRGCSNLRCRNGSPAPSLESDSESSYHSTSSNETVHPPSEKNCHSCRAQSPS